MTILALALAREPCAAQIISPGDPGPADVRLTVDSSAGTKPISPYVYGMNSYATSSWSNPATFDRLGGNRWTGYNWETNASNAGEDYFNHSDTYLVDGVNNTPPGEAVRPSLVSAAAGGQALLATIPLAGYVAADINGTVTSGQTAPSSRWHQVQAKKSTIYPGSALSLTPNETDGYVFTDEYVHWVESKRAANQQVFYSLGNEPGLWTHTHPRLHPNAPTFAELRQKTIAHASAIKDVAPTAKVFGGVGYGWQDFVQIQNAPDATTLPNDEGTGELHFYEWLLQEVAAEEATQGRTLMDVLDLHWYSEATGGGVRVIDNDNSPAVVAARVQATRSLWDPTYKETSWIVDDVINQPIALLPRVQNDIDQFKPGTLISVSEYHYGGTNHISGAVAQADALGIFGQEGVFAAAYWNLHGEADSMFVSAAFDMFLDYDQAGGTFGDLSLAAETDSIAESAVYASSDSSDPNRMTLVAINRTDGDLDTAIEVSHDRQFDTVEIYQLAGTDPTPTSLGEVDLTIANALLYDMPAMSVSTLVLRRYDDGDFSHDALVDGSDLATWAQNFGLSSALHGQGDANRNGDVGGHDLLLWQRDFGRSSTSSFAVPEPATLLLLCQLLLASQLARRNRVVTQ